MPELNTSASNERTIIMNKIVRIENVCCANCGAKIERGINKLKDVNSATINFMTLKLILDYKDGTEETLFPEIEKIAKKVEGDIVFKW